jgi:hypothetical protein
MDSENSLRLLDERLNKCFNSKEFNTALETLKYKMEQGNYDDHIWIKGMTI